jgi:hypothetical protein
VAAELKRDRAICGDDAANGFVGTMGDARDFTERNVGANRFQYRLTPCVLRF